MVQMEYMPDAGRYENMKYNRCGTSGLMLPAISLGLWQNFGSVDDFKTARAMIRRAFDLGVTHFDLANNYGPEPGTAEINFGKILKKDFPGSWRDEMLISTKAGFRMWPGPYGEWGSRKSMLASLDQSLERLNIPYVDIFYSHRPDTETRLEETMMALDQAVRSGKALYAGLSNYSAAQTRDAISILKSLGTPCLIHQPKYSMFERWVEAELLNVLKDEGVGCIAFSPLAQGLLTDRYLNGIPKSSRAAKEQSSIKTADIQGDKIEKAKALNGIAKKRNQTLAQMAIAWLLKDIRVTSVLIGASSVKQLEDNLGAIKNTDFTELERREIELVL
jgi:L-glyceraldehyde 3-phosphate reductase